MPGFDEFTAELEEGGATYSGPQRYFFETILEFLRIENQPIYVIVLPLLVAILLAVAGGVLLKAGYAAIDKVLPERLGALRARAVKLVFLVVGLYLVTDALLYFLDLSLYYAAQEEDTMLVMILAAPRLLLAGPVAVIDAMAGNWVVGIAIILFLALIGWPGLVAREPAPAARSEVDTYPSYSPSALPGEGALEPEMETEDEGPEEKGQEPGARQGEESLNNKERSQKVDEIIEAETRIVAERDTDPGSEDKEE